MCKKGVYPYDDMDSFEKFKKTNLSSKVQFYSILNDQNISDDDYKHTKRVFKGFKRKNKGEYHDLYLLCVWPWNITSWIPLTISLALDYPLCCG